MQKAWLRQFALALYINMTATQFTQWLAAMKTAGLIRFDNDAAKALGVTNDTIVNMKRKGTDTRTALACAALLSGLPPYTGI